MTDSHPPTDGTRRSVLKAAGGLLASTGLLGGVGSAAATAHWTAAEAPTDRTLHAVVETAAGAYAVGGDGHVLHRTETGWERVLESGPAGNGSDLYGTATTDDGRTLWLVGASGAVGAYDVLRGTLTDHSAPDDVTNNFTDVSVVGDAGRATVHIAGDSGKIYRRVPTGPTAEWHQLTPGSGATVHAIDFCGPRNGYAVDGNQTVFATADGAAYEKIGIEDADVNFYAVDAGRWGPTSIAGSGGMVHRFHRGRWSSTSLGDVTIRDIEVKRGNGYAVGGGGVLFERVHGNWIQASTPTGANLTSVVQASTDIAVGASGTVLEK